MIVIADNFNLDRHNDLKTEMFRERAYQFKSRLGWNVQIDANGEERDQYDDCNPMYVVSVNSLGQHKGSLRLLPTNGPTMINDHFSHVVGRKIQDLRVWECTRFCISRGSDRRTAAGLLAATSRVMNELGVLSLVGVFDARMEIIYRRLKCAPRVIGRFCTDLDSVGVGCWNYSEESYLNLLNFSAYSSDEMNQYIENWRCAQQTDYLKRETLANG